MDKTFLLFVAAGIVFLYLVTRFVGDLQKDDGLQTEEYKQEHAYEQYYMEDSTIGETVLNVKSADETKQKEAWNHSPLRQQMMKYFPNFEQMKTFVDLHVQGEPLHTKLMKHIDDVGDAYLSGDIGLDEVKRRLMTL